MSRGCKWYLLTCACAHSNLARPVDFRKVLSSRFSLGTTINQFLRRRCVRNKIYATISPEANHLLVYRLAHHRVDEGLHREGVDIGAYNLTWTHTDASTIPEH
jgi:hypothetical protein